MNQLEVSSSIISAAHLGGFLQRKYGWETNPICKLLKAGINHTYLVNTQERKYVFRIYSFNWRSRAEVEAEIKLLNLLKRHQLSVSYPQADASDQYIQEIKAPEGDRYGVLFTYAKGSKLQTYPEALHYQVGVLMAKIHQVTEGLKLERVTYTPELLLIESLGKIRQFLGTNCEEYGFLERNQRYLLSVLKQLEGKNIPYGIVHMDMWFDNLNITEDEEITLFDFDFCGNGFLCSDIAYYLLQIIHLEREESARLSKTTMFLEGYESIRKIKEEERHLLPIMGMCSYYFYLGVQCERHENWSNVFLNKAYLKRYIKLIIGRYYEISKLKERVEKLA